MFASKRGRIVNRPFICIVARDSTSSKTCAACMRLRYTIPSHQGWSYPAIPLGSNPSTTSKHRLTLPLLPSLKRFSLRGSLIELSIRVHAPSSSNSSLRQAQREFFHRSPESPPPKHLWARLDNCSA